ncbi:hypothetical protein OAS39_10190, partial [Pirellulales bacterium]|nr:hypothetical protein [Pirellulales bacterium]
SVGRLGFMWLFAAGGVLMVRMLVDPAFTRRPLLEPNLNTAGLLFLAGALAFFLTANVVFGRPSAADTSPGLKETKVMPEAVEPGKTDETVDVPASADTFATAGPGFSWLYRLPRIATQQLVGRGEIGSAHAAPHEAAQQQEMVLQATAKAVAILSHLAVVSGLLIVGSRHFGNASSGAATATMYLMMPCTALFAGGVAHLLPSALLVWAIVLYRRPTLAGMMIGLAAGTIYYPAFLIPLWCSYYWERGVKRFATGLVIMIVTLAVTQVATAGSWEDTIAHLRQMFGIRLPTTEGQGIWKYWVHYYRLPVLGTFVALSVSFVAWPVRKHLGTLICCSAALMIGTQFWHAYGGGLYVAWYLPLVLLAIYRPNLEDRIALNVVEEGWWQRRQRTLT